MKKLIETIKNIFKIEELRKRILFTLALILVYRFGSFVVIPGINPESLSALQQQVEGTGLMGQLTSSPEEPSATRPSSHWVSCPISRPRSSSS